MCFFSFFNIYIYILKVYTFEILSLRENFEIPTVYGVRDVLVMHELSPSVGANRETDVSTIQYSTIQLVLLL